MMTTVFVADGYLQHRTSVQCPDCGAEEPLLLPEACWQCPNCRRSYSKSSHITQVVLKRAGKKIILALPRKKERIEFHLSSGRVVLYRERSICDTTFHDFWQSSETYRTVNNHKVKRALHRLFTEVWGKPLPIGWQALTPEICVMLTAFVGYPKEFYPTVPLSLDTQWGIHRRFRKIARRLRNAQKLDQVVRSLTGPGSMKSLRRSFFRQPGFLFYPREIMFLWELSARDPNRLRSILGLDEEKIFRMLSFLNTYPGTEVFFRDYTGAAGFRSLLTLIGQDIALAEAYAPLWAAMDPAERERRKPKLGRRDTLIGTRRGYSTPVQTPKNIREYTTEEGYRFSPLLSTHGYIYAGKALENCIGQMCRQTPVVVICSEAGYHGAVEVVDDVILQAEGPKNTPLPPDVKEAYLIWKDHFGLHEDYAADSDDGDEDYCF